MYLSCSLGIALKIFNLLLLICYEAVKVVVICDKTVTNYNLQLKSFSRLNMEFFEMSVQQTLDPCWCLQPLHNSYLIRALG